MQLEILEGWNRFSYLLFKFEIENRSRHRLNHCFALLHTTLEAFLLGFLGNLASLVMLTPLLARLGEALVNREVLVDAFPAFDAAPSSRNCLRFGL